MKYEVPADSLFANGWTVSAQSIADVPERLKAQIREEALLDAFNQLEASLRLLLYATTPDKEPPTAERCHQILNVWRYELEHRIRLTPDTYCGAVQRYEPDMERSYTIDGRCERGDLLRIRVPCWRMHDRIVVRGEAEILRGDQLPEALRNLATGAAPDSNRDPLAEMMAATSLSEPDSHTVHGPAATSEAQTLVAEAAVSEVAQASDVPAVVNGGAVGESAATFAGSSDADDFAALRAAARAEVSRLEQEAAEEPAAVVAAE